jgi:hypothetical protein
MTLHIPSPLNDCAVDQITQRIIEQLQSLRCKHRPLTPSVVHDVAINEMKSWAHGESDVRLRGILGELGVDSQRLLNHCVGGVHILPTLTYSVLHGRVMYRAVAFYTEHLQPLPFDMATAPKSNGECGICYGDGEGLVELPCRHRFGADCLRRWLACNQTCPMCRFEINSRE